MNKKKQWGVMYDNPEDMAHPSSTPTKIGQGPGMPNIVEQSNADTELQGKTANIDYRTWWSESESKNHELKKEIEDLKAQIERLKAVLKDVI